MDPLNWQINKLKKGSQQKSKEATASQVSQSLRSLEID